MPGESFPSLEMVWGFHAVESLLKHDSTRVREIVLGEKRHDKRIKTLEKLVRQAGSTIRYVDGDELNAMSPGENHQGVIAILEPVKAKENLGLSELVGKLGEQSIVLILDHIQDPHNLGACLRTAAGAGVDLVIIPKAGACPVNNTVRKVSSGAVDLVEICQVANLNRSLNVLKDAGFWIYGAADDGEKDLYDCEIAGKVGLVMGEEGPGLRKLTRSCCDHLVRIPMHSKLESLNVSVATGVFLFEIRRQMG